MRTLFLSALFLWITLCSWTFDEDRFRQLIDATKDEIVKKKLIAFQSKGIEKTVDTSKYNKEELIALSKSYLGTPHLMRGTSKKGIDCSGLMMVVHRVYGVTLPHSSHEQARFGKIVAVRDSLQKGDLVFFYNSYQSANFITHAGLYLGENEFIHASASRGVIITSMDDKYWSTRYLFATRLKD
jgi:murein DD-endopeptidase / murein LD-carboxypeptidase